MVRIDRTHDMQLVRELATHDSVWPHISDDGCDRESYQPIDHPSIYWLLAIEGPDVLGAYMVIPENTATYRIHVFMLPSAYGPKAHKAGSEVLRWIFKHTPARKLSAQISEKNALAYRYAKRAGFVDEGINRRSLLKDGVLLNQRILGITREESWLRQPKP